MYEWLIKELSFQQSIYMHINNIQLSEASGFVRPAV
jgi:hypothetical protein